MPRAVMAGHEFAQIENIWNPSDVLYNGALKFVGVAAQCRVSQQVLPLPLLLLQQTKCLTLNVRGYLCNDPGYACTTGVGTPGD